MHNLALGLALSLSPIPCWALPCKLPSRLISRSLNLLVFLYPYTLLLLSFILFYPLCHLFFLFKPFRICVDLLH